MALTTISTVSGTIQKYFERSWMDLPQEDFRTPLANSQLLERAVIPRNKGQYAEFRTFDHLTIETNGTDDSPKTYGENAEPSSPLVLSASVVQVAFEMLADYLEIGNVADATDSTGLVKKGKEEMMLVVRRKIHRLTNDRCVKTITANVLNASLSPSPLPQPFKTLFASGAADYGELTSDSVHTMADYKRARSALRNSRAPGIFGSLYAAIIDEAIKDQLLDDPNFRDAAKRHEDMTQKAFGMGTMMDYEGMRWIIQDDAYRCALPAASGALTTRSDSGLVHVGHVLGKSAMGYVDFAGSNSLQRRTLRPQFKVQDISSTGTGPTIGWRMPYQAIVLNRNRGLNVAGTSRYNETVSDLS